MEGTTSEIQRKTKFLRLQEALNKWKAPPKSGRGMLRLSCGLVIFWRVCRWWMRGNFYFIDVFCDRCLGLPLCLHFLDKDKIIWMVWCKVRVFLSWCFALVSQLLDFALFFPIVFLFLFLEVGHLFYVKFV